LRKGSKVELAKLKKLEKSSREMKEVAGVHKRPPMTTAPSIDACQASLPGERAFRRKTILQVRERKTAPRAF